jgi:hypothetical protein
MSCLDWLIVIQAFIDTESPDLDAEHFPQRRFLRRRDLMASGGPQGCFNRGGVRWLDSAFRDLIFFRLDGCRPVSMCRHVIYPHLVAKPKQFAKPQRR